MKNKRKQAPIDPTKPGSDWFAMLFHSAAKKHEPQKWYEPVGDRRRRMEANKADPSRRRRLEHAKYDYRVQKYRDRMQVCI